MRGNVLLCLLAIRFQSSCKNGLKVCGRGGRGWNLRHSVVDEWVGCLRENRKVAETGRKPLTHCHWVTPCDLYEYDTPPADTQPRAASRDNGQRRGRKMWYPFAPGQVQVQNRTATTKILSKHLMICVRLGATGGGNRSAFQLYDYGIPYLWNPLPHQPKTQLSSSHALSE